MIMNNPVSVVIPTHNRPDGLAEAVKSIFKQTLLPKELIVVDDGSKPPVSEGVFAGCPTGLIAKLFRNESPKGANNARNRGINEATGEWIAFLDDDDAFFVQKIDVINEFILKNPKADLFYHPAEINLVREKITYTSGTSDASKYKDLVKQLLIRNIVGGTSMVVIRKSSLADVGGFDETLPAMQDKELYIRLAKNGSQFCYINKALTKYHHDTTAQSITHSHDKGKMAMALIQQKHASVFAGLSKREQNAIRTNYFRNQVFKSLLNNDIRGSFQHQWALFKQSPSPKNLGMLCIIPFGVKAVFKVRSYLQ